jgi:fructose-1,6-bisphosphatase I
VFLYPGDAKNPNGKLRLLYEAAPLAFLAEAAGGAASNGQERILDLVPDGLHVRTPLVIGSRYEVSAIQSLLAGDRESAFTTSKGASA